MSASTPTPADRVTPQTDRERAHWWYDRVLGVVDANIGGEDHPQRRYVSLATVLQIACRERSDATRVRSTIRTVVRNGDLVVLEDQAGAQYLTRASNAWLDAIIATEAESEDPDRRLIGTANIARWDL